MITPPTAQCCWFDDCWANERSDEEFHLYLFHFVLYTLLTAHDLSTAIVNSKAFGNFPFLSLNFTSWCQSNTTALTLANKQTFIIFCFEPGHLLLEKHCIPTLPEFLNSPDHWPLNPSVTDINDRLHSWGACVIPSVFTNRLKYDPLTECCRARRYPCHGSLRAIITSTPVFEAQLWEIVTHKSPVPSLIQSHFKL